MRNELIRGAFTGETEGTVSEEYRALIDECAEKKDLPDAQLLRLLDISEEADEAYLYAKAREVRERSYGKEVYLRGLIEFTNYCRNDCLYCGIRCSNAKADRYRLTGEEIAACADQGYDLGFRTAVLQGGEDMHFSDEEICSIVREIRAMHPDMAVTLSIGERSRQSYEKYFAAGAERYLLRHETADPVHYARLHPAHQTWETKKRCLQDLKDIGYQVGTGMMVGTPYQTRDCYLADFRFLQEIDPQMIGIGPFIPHSDTPFAGEAAGSVTETLHLISILRLFFPNALIPATTALGTKDPFGREKGVLAGANVVMPNLSPRGVRKKYLLYDGKICTGDEAAECRFCMERRIESVGYRVVVSRGDYRSSDSENQEQ
ncbi:MAG: [FeFe] hydrogenase H-cluster radical SAM maturase HydE [Lachnospiraceae bacterium]|nr:[FeFe] hydrogenase H-cluster radical SAM maturase HydE [Lachnospiraceae bacterium]